MLTVSSFIKRSGRKFDIEYNPCYNLSMKEIYLKLTNKWLEGIGENANSC